MSIRQDYWVWALSAFGKNKLRELVAQHPLGENLYLNEQERLFVEEQLE